MTPQDEHGTRNGLLGELDDLRTILDDGIADEDIPVLEDEIVDDGAVVPLLPDLPAQGLSDDMTPETSPREPSPPEPSLPAPSIPALAPPELSPPENSAMIEARIEARIDALLDAWVRETLEPELDALRTRLLDAARELLVAAHAPDRAADTSTQSTERTNGQ
ncbi:MAG: hypothetical protein KF911_07500 [Pseudomonadales bacterium]|nr:hypothetical protein [Pseudomonadales bacterium]